MESDGGTTQVQVDDFYFHQSPITATSTNPSFVSPIAFRTIDIQLTDTYPVETMSKDDFYVMIVPYELEKTQLIINNEGRRELNVVAVDQTAKTITVKYGGAYSGTYDVIIKSEINGYLYTGDF